MKLDYYKSGKSSGKRTAELDYAGLLKVLEEPRLRTICDTCPALPTWAGRRQVSARPT